MNEELYKKLNKLVNEANYIAYNNALYIAVYILDNGDIEWFTECDYSDHVFDVGLIDRFDIEYKTDAYDVIKRCVMSIDGAEEHSAYLKLSFPQAVYDLRRDLIDIVYELYAQGISLANDFNDWQREKILEYLDDEILWYERRKYKRSLNK